MQLRQHRELGGGDFGWLKAKHHFAVDVHGNPAHRALGALIVWNDDEIAPGTGFPLHGHKDLEIVTYVRQGVVGHEDSAGNRGQVDAGNVQVISAGTGIRHTEYNHGPEPLKIYQIWLVPREKGAAPRWDTRPFPKADRSNRLVVLASGFADDGEALPVRADARVLGATLMHGKQLTYTLAPGRYAYLVSAIGSVRVNGQAVRQGDGVALRDEPILEVEALEDSEIVLVDAA